MLSFGCLLRPLQPIATSLSRVFTTALPNRTTPYQQRPRRKVRDTNRSTIHRVISTKHESYHIKNTHRYQVKKFKKRHRIVTSLIIHDEQGTLLNSAESDTSVCSHAAACCGDTADSLTVQM